MIYFVPIVGPAIAFFFTVFLAIPLYFLWNWMAPIYFYWLPQVYHQIPFWDCVWLMMLFSILKLIFYPRLNAEIKVEKE